MRLDPVSTTAVAPPTGTRPEHGTTPQRPSGHKKAVSLPEHQEKQHVTSETERKLEPAEMHAMLDTINDRLSRVNRRIDVYLVEGTHEVAARVVDTESNEVVKYLPPEEVLELRSRLDEMVGLLFDKGA